MESNNLTISKLKLIESEMISESNTLRDLISLINKDYQNPEEEEDEVPERLKLNSIFGRLDKIRMELHEQVENIYSDGNKEYNKKLSNDQVISLFTIQRNIDRMNLSGELMCD